MVRKQSNLASRSFVELLEARHLLSHTIFATRLQLSATITNGEIGTSLTIPAAAKLTAAGLPLRTATIEFIEDGTTVIGEAQTGRSGYASVVLPNVYVGKHSIQAVFEGAERYVKSASGRYTASVTAPSTHTTTSDGIEESTIIAGSGTATLQSNSFAAVDYNGYLESGGGVFDSTAAKTPFTFQDNDPGVPQGFAEGVLGMKVGETREIIVPPSLGYGSVPQPNIPANSTLVYIIKLEALD